MTAVITSYILSIRSFIVPVEEKEKDIRLPHISEKKKLRKNKTQEQIIVLEAIF